MMVVIADTSPIFIPEEVAAELADRNTPAAVRFWMDQRPRWIAIRSAPIADPGLVDLDAERRRQSQWLKRKRMYFC